MNESDVHHNETIQACRGFEPMTFAVQVQCSTNWANQPTGQLECGHYVGSHQDVVTNCVD